jgi:hypothetical protein
VTTTTPAILAANQAGPATSTTFVRSATAALGVRASQQPVGAPLQEAVPVDVVEPFQPAAPEVEAQPALPTSAARSESLPAFAAPDFETLIDLSIADLYAEAPVSPSRADSGFTALTCVTG